jgi:hypothetical protein
LLLIVAEGEMPEISRFFGIIIKMFFNDHTPPHFHAFYQGARATFSIHTGLMIEGKFPLKQSAFVTAWALMHEKELMTNWKALKAGKEANKIVPLR